MSFTSGGIPTFGFGTARLRGTDGAKAIRAAVDVGIRHFDTAKCYGNEELLGTVLRSSLEDGTVKSRGDLFVTSKLWNDDHQPAHVAAACRSSLERLGLGYLDLYLVHWPVSWRKGTLGCPDSGVTLEETWRAMEKLVDEGLVRAIGVSNFGERRLSQLLALARIKPACNQIELHPRLQQPSLVKFCQRSGVVVVAWSPLAKGGPLASAGPAIEAMAEQRGLTPTQLTLLWHLSRGVVPIPRSSNPGHIRENFDVWKRATSQDSPTAGRQGEPGPRKRVLTRGTGAAGRGCAGVGGGGLALLTGGELADFAALNTGTRLVRDFVGIFEDTSWPWSLVGSILVFFARVVWAIIPNRLDFKMPK